jgi:methionyl-tRNA synthetase
MREMVVGQDANFTFDSFMQRYNSDLANDFGNLLSRVTTLIHKNYAGEIPEPGELSEQELSIKSKSEELNILVKKLIGDMKINEAIEEIMQFIRNVNKYMEKNAPWKMVKEDKVNAGRVLYTAGEALRIGAVLLSPVMPNRTLILLDALSSEKYSYHWGGLSTGAKLKKHSPLFPRLK